MKEMNGSNLEIELYRMLDKLPVQYIVTLLADAEIIPIPEYMSEEEWEKSVIELKILLKLFSLNQTLEEGITTFNIGPLAEA